jgi:hypothetical protein
MEGQNRVTSIFRRISREVRFVGSIAAVSSVVWYCSTGTAQDSAKEPVYPEIGPTTHFLDHDVLIAGFAEAGWYKANIPFIDIPDNSGSSAGSRFMGPFRDREFAVSRPKPDCALG